MYGPPGCGKTCTIQMIIEQLISDGGITIYSTEADDLIYWLPKIRQLDEDRKIVILLEDFDTLVEYDENGWLALLDGEHQIDSICYLATTNYIENFDQRFINRPSRFDVIVPVPMLSRESRELYIKYKLPDLSDNIVTEYVQMTEGFQVAHLKEFIISTECFGKTPTQAEEQLRGQMKLHKPKKGSLQVIDTGRSFDDEEDIIHDYDEDTADEVMRLVGVGRRGGR